MTNKYDYFVIVVLLGLFGAFIFSATDGFSIEKLVVFTELYRNGYYKGSGMLVQPLLIYSSLLVLFECYSSKHLASSSRFWVALIALGLASFVVGLRVYLFQALIHILSRFNLRRPRSTISLALLSSVLIAVSAFFKLFLGVSEDQGVFLDSFTRLRSVELYSIVSNIEFNVDDLMELFSHLGNSEASKEIIFSSHAHILSAAFPNLSKFSGVAMPAPIFLLVFGPLLSTILLMITFLMATLSGANIPKSIYYLQPIAIIVFASLITGLNEDLMNSLVTFCYYLSMLVIYMTVRLRID
jgi:hypothetical protein